AAPRPGTKTGSSSPPRWAPPAPRFPPAPPRSRRGRARPVLRDSGNSGLERGWRGRPLPFSIATRDRPRTPLNLQSKIKKRKCQNVAGQQGGGGAGDEGEGEQVGRPGGELGQRTEAAVEAAAAHRLADALRALEATHQQRAGDVADRAVAVPVR